MPASDFEKVPTTKSTSSRTPCSSAQPRPVRSVGAERMRLVHENVGAVGPADVDDLAQRRDVAADGVQPFDDDQPVASLRGQPLQLLAQALGRVVAEADDLRRGLPRRVVDAGVAVAVDQDDVAGAAQAADERQVRLVAGAEDDRVALAEPVGQLALEIFVQRERAVGRPRSGGAGAVLEHGAARRLGDVGMERETEIVVRAEHQASAGRRRAPRRG